MKLATLNTLIQAGVTFNLRLSKADGDKIQFDVLPVSEKNKSGINLAPKSILGTAQELDEFLPTFFEKYALSCRSIKLTTEALEAELAADEQHAAQVAKEVAEERKTAHKTTTAKSVTPVKPARNLDAGMIDDESSVKTTGEPGEAEGEKAEGPVPEAGSGTSALAAAFL